MALTYNKQTRTLSLRGVITRSDGTQISLTTDDILSYSISESSGSEGLPLGSAEASSFSLTISNVGKGYTPQQFDNAEVHMEVGLKSASGTITYSSFGVWYVCDVSAPEQSVSIDLSGYDALATLFESTYTDAESAYPTTLGSLATTICAAAGISMTTAAFRNADVAVQSIPDWGDEVTLRTIIGYISACAGGFARITRNGKLEIMSYCDGQSYSINSDIYSALTRVNGSGFKFNALEVKELGAEEETYTRYAVNASLEDNPTNTIRIEDNPLFTAGIAASVKELLTGIEIVAASLNWGADPAVRISDKLSVVDTQNNTLVMLVNSQSITFAGGMSATSACNLPALNSANSGSYTSSGNIIDSNGNIRVRRIANFDKSVVNATAGHFEELTATSASIDRLLAGIIDAIKLRADNISASSIDTDKLTAAIASIMEATIKKLNAGSITTDELFANVAEIVRLKVSQLNAGNISTDTFATELARVTVLICGSASFDKATIKHLVAEAMNLEYGVAGQVFIRNLAVEYAQMVGATIGNLCIKSKDGKYYLLDVDADGNVTATETTVTDSEIEAGQTSDGNVIVETNMTVANLNTTNLLATYALINKIDAARIDVDELIARSVFTDALYTSAIYGGRSLKTIVDGLTEADIYDSVTPPETAETGKKWLDRGVSPSQLRRWKGLTTTPQGDTITTAREIDESVSGTSVSIDNSNNQLSGPLSVTVQGKNLLDIYALCDGITGVQGGTISKWASSGGFEIDATADDCYTEPWNGANDIPVKPNTTYTFSWGIYITPTLGTSQVVWFIDRRYPESGYYGAVNYDAYSVTFTTPADAKFVSFRFGLQKSGDKIGYGSLQLEEGSTKTTFSAYKTAVTVTHNGAAYALPLDTVDHSANIDISPSIGVNAVSTDADSMEIEYICSGWETVNDPDALNDLFQTQITQTKDSLSAEITNLRTDISLYLRSYKDADNNIEGVELGRTDTNTVSRIVPGAFQVWAPDDSGQMVKTASLGNRESQIGRLRIYQTADGGTAFNVM